MAMVQIRVMWMSVPQGGMLVEVGVGFRHFALMRMLVMLVMHVHVFMLQITMGMLVLMPFSQVKPRTECH